MLSLNEDEVKIINNIRVVYFEDDYITAEYTKKCLFNYFTKVDLISEPLSSFDNIDFKAYDLVITDINMTEIDGFSLIEKIKKQNNDLKFIIISAFTDMNFLKRAEELGVLGYLSKPVMFDKIEIILKELLKEEKKDFSSYFYDE